MELKKFCLNDYDCIGFDLDCTLAEYKVEELMKLVYDLLCDFLIKKKFYPSEIILKPFEEGKYFLQKSLFMDFKKGNILKISDTGKIVKATHGTQPLSEEEIIEIYGANKSPNAFKEFIRDPLSMLNPLYSKEVRTSLDIFDMPCLLLFARLVDQCDKLNNGILKEYNLWPDIVEGLNLLYMRHHFSSGDSDFFLALKENPSLYYTPCSIEKINWLKEIKKTKFTFLLTGSFIDFVQLTATTCIGENWQDYFDIILCYARKPYFFMAGRPFLQVENNKETDAVEEGGLKIKSVYSQGNWEELKALISKHTNIKEPKCLYIGDNIIQDVYSPDHFKCCDTVSVLPELKHNNSIDFWGSFFEGEEGSASFWNYLMKSHAKICVSDLDVMSKKPLNFEYVCLKGDNNIEISESTGYYVS